MPFIKAIGIKITTNVRNKSDVIITVFLGNLSARVPANNPKINVGKYMLDATKAVLDLEPVMSKINQGNAIM